VQAALDGADPDRALELLDAYQRSRGSQLWAEAQLLRMEALSRAGKSEQASRLAEDFVASHPGNPLIDRARVFVGTSPE
jgi:outer membrane protein assembly factor BamD (BamD/ComL family)